MNFDSQTWTELSQAFAFLGNSLLAPMSQTERYGVDPSFWREFPDFGDEEVAASVSRCLAYAEGKRAALDEDDLVREISVEYTHLFIGPPRPSAAPWETFYRNADVSVGFGEATFEMQRLLREAGLRISNENNQYADHIGIELLYLATLCERAACGDQASAEAGAAFAADRPLVWIDAYCQRICDERADGYYRGVVELASALLSLVACESAEPGK
ncbi:molecular chaperone [Adlercreutzia sp. ZJ242]|uniref:TorD/DmsD family molecular chaperone n=1 Tax=Adlercreutzia sp. ZJ242 TaxID=2709409 RepID=UPI0013EDE93B|nr:molecular chaperone TorD family protein [Adlercreutzia sp. ZJ242]